MDHVKRNELLFDDEPLERILYGKDLPGPTRANLYLSSMEYVDRIEQLFSDGNMQAAIETASELTSRGYSISQNMCFTLSRILKRMVPNFPNPVMTPDLSGLQPLFEKIWTQASKTGNKELQEELGSFLYRWYEHHGLYEEARGVLSVMINISKIKGDRNDEAVFLNNLAFEYLLEGRWQEAIPLFQEAEEIFKKVGDSFSSANSRANYWTCRFELGDIVNFEEAAAELEFLAQTLKRSDTWHSRKPLILLAKIQEKRGNLSAAIQLVEQTIKDCSDSHTRYPELDAEYLDHLKIKCF